MKYLKPIRRRKYMRIQFFMRSGHTFIVDGVEHCDIEGSDGKISSLTLTQAKLASKSRLLVASLDLRQVEAVVRLPD